MEEVLNLLFENIPEFPKPVKLKLPNINNIKLPKPKKLADVEG